MKRLFILILILFSFVKTVSAGEKIVYSHLTDGYWQIWTMNPDGKEQKQITVSPEDKRNPTQSNDGQMIAYRTNNGHLFTVDFNGENEQILLKEFDYINCPVFLKNKNEIVFVRFDPQGRDLSDIWKAGLDGRNSILLTNDKFWKSYPAISSQNDKIVFVKADEERFAHVWIMDSDGRRQEQLTFDRSYDFYPHFSPDGEHIIFSSNRESNDYEIYSLSLKTKKISRLTSSPGLDTNPSYSPDGKKIIFISNRSGDTQIWTMGHNGKNPQQLTFNQDDSMDPVWFNLDK